MNSSRSGQHLRQRAAQRSFVYWLALAGTLSAACSQGDGEGYVRTAPGGDAGGASNLYIRDCWNYPFDLQPSFFGANPTSSNQLSIRVQRGDDNEEVSDGLSVLIYDVQKIRSQLNTPVHVGLPVGVSPPGMPLIVNPNPPIVSLVLYLHDSCHAQNGVIYSIDGTITFKSLFSGNANETKSDERLTDASFDSIVFADPRDMNVDRTYPAGVQSNVQGAFKFYFQRGQPAQPFP